jgi:Fur family ferric uptake transcriptional regulator
MTVVSTTPPRSAGTLDEAFALLRSQGLRLSSARRRVLEALFLAPGPLTAEAIARGFDRALPPSDLGSVYRNLEVLEGIGLVRHVHLGHGPGLYRRSGVAEPLVVCESCGTSIALDPSLVEPVATVVREVCGIDARFDHFPIVGTCATCAGQGPERRVPCTFPTDS